MDAIKEKRKSSGAGTVQSGTSKKAASSKGGDEKPYKSPPIDTPGTPPKESEKKAPQVKRKTKTNIRESLFDAATSNQTEAPDATQRDKANKRSLSKPVRKSVTSGSVAKSEEASSKKNSLQQPDGDTEHRATPPEGHRPKKSLAGQKRGEGSLSSSKGGKKEKASAEKSEEYEGSSSMEEEGENLADDTDYFLHSNSEEYYEASEEADDEEYLTHEPSRRTLLLEMWQEISLQIRRTFDEPCRVFKLRGYHSEPDLSLPFEDKFDLVFKAPTTPERSLARSKDKFLSCEDISVPLGNEYPELMREDAEEVEIMRKSHYVDEKMKAVWKEIVDLENKRYSFFDELFARGYVVDSLEVLSPHPRGEEEGEENLEVVDDEYFVEADEKHYRQKVDYGRVVFKTKHVYTGNFSDWYFHGPGRYSWQDGTVYQGEFSRGLMHGPGSIHWPDGSVYEGRFINGSRTGWGIFSNVDGQTFAGEWLKGLPHGHGKMWYDPEDDDNDYYEGHWEKGAPHGVGTRQYATGDRYVGHWERGMRNGYGIMIWLQERQVYKGDWLDGVPHGFGKHIWYLERSETNPFPTRHVYEGAWESGRRDGIGKMIYPCGSVYEGRWKNGQRHGKGMFVNPAGDILVGLFRAGAVLGGSDVPLHAPTYDCDYGGLTEWLTAKFSLNVNELVVEEPLHEITKHYLSYIRELYHRAGEFSHKYGNHGLYPPYLKKEDYSVGDKRRNYQHSRPYHKNHPDYKHYTRRHEPEHMKSKVSKSEPLDWVSPVTRFGLWLLIKDCDGLLGEVTMAYFDKIWNETPPLSFQTAHNPFEPVYLWQFLQCLIVVAVAYYVDIPRLPKPSPVKVSEELAASESMAPGVTTPMSEEMSWKESISEGGEQNKRLSGAATGDNASAKGGLSAEPLKPTASKFQVKRKKGKKGEKGGANPDPPEPAPAATGAGGGKKGKGKGKQQVMQSKGNLDVSEVGKEQQQKINNEAAPDSKSKSSAPTQPTTDPESSEGMEHPQSENSPKRSSVMKSRSLTDEAEASMPGPPRPSEESIARNESSSPPKEMVNEVDDNENEVEDLESLEEGFFDEGLDSIFGGEEEEEELFPISPLTISECFERLLLEKLLPCLKRESGANLPIVPLPLPALADMFDAFQEIETRDIIHGAEFLRYALPPPEGSQAPPSATDLSGRVQFSRIDDSSITPEPRVTTGRIQEMRLHSNVDTQREDLIENVWMSEHPDERPEVGMKVNSEEQLEDSEYLGIKADQSEATLRALNLCKDNPDLPECQKATGARGGIRNSLIVQPKAEELEELNALADFATDGNPFGEEELVSKPFLWADDYKCIPVQRKYFDNIVKNDVLFVLRYLYPGLYIGATETDMNFDLVFCDWLWCTSLLAKTSAERDFPGAWRIDSAVARKHTNPQSLGVYTHYIKQIKMNPYLSPNPPPDFKPKDKSAKEMREVFMEAEEGREMDIVKEEVEEEKKQQPVVRSRSRSSNYSTATGKSQKSSHHSQPLEGGEE